MFLQKNHGMLYQITEEICFSMRSYSCPWGFVLNEPIVHFAETVGYAEKMKHQSLVLIAEGNFIHQTNYKIGRENNTNF